MSNLITNIMKTHVINTYDLTIEESLELIPNFFYKYCRIDKYLKINLKNSQLWFNAPDNFNDPFDCMAYLNFGKTPVECNENHEKLIAAFEIELPELNKNIWKSLIRKPDDYNMVMSYAAAKNLKKDIGVSCFSENYKNTLMWANYADSHKGLVLKFRKDINGFITKNMIPINYHKKYPIINVSDYKAEQMISIIYQVVGAKGNAWKYEKEWRAITSPGNSLCDFNKNELAGIIFGLNTDDSEKKEVYDLVMNSGYDNITFQEAEFNEREFTIKYKKYKCE